MQGLPEKPTLTSACQATPLREPTPRSQVTIWFQLVKIWATIFLSKTADRVHERVG